MAGKWDDDGAEAGLILLQEKLDEKDIALLKTIITIGQTFNLNIVAEGTETEEQITLLRELGCTIAQGYYFSRPIKANEFEERYLKKESVSTNKR